MSLNLKKYEIDLIDKWEKFIKCNKYNSWILFNFEGKTFDLIHCGSGDFGMQELKDKLDNSQVMYGAICVKDKNSGLEKIVFIFWRGKAAPTNIRGTAITFNTSVRNFFQGYSFDITASSKDEILIGLVKNKVKSDYSALENKKDPKTKGCEELPDKKEKLYPNISTTTIEFLPSESPKKKFEDHNYERNINIFEKVNASPIEDTNENSNIKDKIKSIKIPRAIFDRTSQNDYENIPKLQKIEPKITYFSDKSLFLSSIPLNEKKKNNCLTKRLQIQKEMNEISKQSKVNEMVNQLKSGNTMNSSRKIVLPKSKIVNSSNLNQQKEVMRSLGY